MQDFTQDTLKEPRELYKKEVIELYPKHSLKSLRELMQWIQKITNYRKDLPDSKVTGLRSLTIKQVTILFYMLGSPEGFKSIEEPPAELQNQ